ncbi:MAG: PaaI family thioesterase [Chromatiales bacterium]|jgi:acyl-coenzyme A thioesterase PaaI-like protein|nr:PaaI family thioesterase [Chromatiales bacterium]
MTTRRPDANRCFVCGPDNPLGLQLAFRLDEENHCRTEFTPGPHHGGWDQLTHGGILYSALDDVMANWLFLQGLRAYTARCEVRYRKPHPLGVPLALTGRLVQRRGRVAVMAGEARRADDGTLVAEAEASFMVEPGPATPQALSGGGASNTPMS